MREYIPTFSGNSFAFLRAAAKRMQIFFYFLGWKLPKKSLDNTIQLREFYDQTTVFRTFISEPTFYKHFLLFHLVKEKKANKFSYVFLLDDRKIFQRQFSKNSDQK